MIVNKLPALGDLSGQPWEFRLSGVRDLWDGRIIYDDGDDYYVTLTNTEKVTSNYVIGQTYNCFYIEPNSLLYFNLTFTVISVVADGSDWRLTFSLSDIVSTGSPTNIIYLAKNNTTLLTSIAVSIKDTDTDVVNTFEFPVSTAGDCGFYLGSFINNLVKAKGLVIPNITTITARAGNYEITVNGVQLQYPVGYGGKFNLGLFLTRFKRPNRYFRRENDGFILSRTNVGNPISFCLDEYFLFADYPTDDGDGFLFVIRTPCNSTDYQLKTLQIGEDVFDISYPVVRFLNQLGGVEEAWANGNNELNLNQGDAAYSQSILGSLQLVGRKDSYQTMSLTFNPTKYLTDIREVEVEINRLQAIRLSDYVELRVKNQSGAWKSIQVQVEPDSTNIASNRDNQNNATVSINVTFANPL